MWIQKHKQKPQLSLTLIFSGQESHSDVCLARNLNKHVHCRNCFWMQNRQSEFRYHSSVFKKAYAFQQLPEGLGISHLLFKSINTDIFLKKKKSMDNYQIMNNSRTTQVFSSFINMFPSCWDYQYPSTPAAEHEAQFNCEENSVDRAEKYLLQILLGIITSSKHCLHKCS